jgi:hypothetical protein
VLYAFGFERVGVVLGDLYFVDPRPLEGQEGAEHGVRLELRVLAREALRGSIYSAQPISVGQPIWRVDLLESVAGPPGSFDRTHHHPAFRGWDPGPRKFVEELSAEPLVWLGRRLADLPGVLKEAGMPAAVAGDGDAAGLRAAAPEIVAAAGRLLERVRAGELGRAPGTGTPGVPAGHGASERAGWL